MTLINQFIAELEREAPRTRRVLAEVPTGKDDWKPHTKSMPSAASLDWWPRCRRGFRSSSIRTNSTSRRLPGGGQYKPPAIDQLVAVHNQLLAKA